jgi:hypothetical protein
MRLGHVNFDSLKMMAKKRDVEGSTIHYTSNQLCKGCLMSKQFRKSFPNESTSRASQHLQEIHAYIFGSIKLWSFDKNLYFLLFTDDYSRKT